MCMVVGVAGETRPLLGSLKTSKTYSYGAAEGVNANSCSVSAKG